MTAITVYGIPQCDTVKKTLSWFKKHKVNIGFWDYKKSGITKEKLETWCTKTGWEVLLNKKSATWRGLTLPEQEKITSRAAAIKLMLKNTSIIKRPVIEINDKLLVGFDEKEITKQLK